MQLWMEPWIQGQNRSMTRKHIAGTVAATGLLAAGYAAYRFRRMKKAEIERLASILGWAPGRTVAEVGAGSGGLAAAAAERVGAGGRVLATEVEPKKLARIRRKAEKQRLNVDAVRATQEDTRLPEAGCDAILLRGSYHHFTDPARITAGLYRALRPRGVLAVVDFPPRKWLGVIAPLKGVPANRGGHGIPQEVLSDEMMAAGFVVDKVIPRWFLDVYCVVFRKP
jgi:ubiquinone/menaquinone biosynthesis C-methylase UbiE